jgi:hypothetical protein
MPSNSLLNATRTPCDSRRRARGLRGVPRFYAELNVPGEVADRARVRRARRAAGTLWSRVGDSERLLTLGSSAGSLGVKTSECVARRSSRGSQRGIEWASRPRATRRAPVVAEVETISRKRGAPIVPESARVGSHSTVRAPRRGAIHRAVTHRPAPKSVKFVGTNSSENRGADHGIRRNGTNPSNEYYGDLVGARSLLAGPQLHHLLTVSTDLRPHR